MTDEFDERNRRNIAAMAEDEQLQSLSRQWLVASSRHEYSYHFKWLGRPIIQFPHDILAMQEIIWTVKPDLIIETGVARGGSCVFYASMLELLGGDGRVVSIDIDIRPENRSAIEAHPMFKRISLIEGSSTSGDVVARVRELARGRRAVLVALDSNHTYEHVRDELACYSGLVTSGSYLVVFDTVIEHMPEDFYPDRPWKPGNSPHTAVAEFLRTTDRFEVDTELEHKLLVSVAPSGYLRCRV
jgi:cephalosporin hydroxylase